MAQGLILKVTHGGLSPRSVLLADVFDGTDAPATARRAGAVYVPVGGSVELVFTNSVAKSYESGDIRKQTLAGHVTAAFLFGTGYGDAFPQHMRVTMPVSPGNTILEVLWAPAACRVLGVTANIETAAVSVGTYTAALTGAGNNLLSAATFNLKTLVQQTVTAIPLTATAAHKLLAANARIALTVASNNGDLTGAGLSFNLKYALQ